MTEVSSKDVVRLRAETGIGVKECKLALEEAKGDFAAALDALKRKGLAQAAKKSSREAKEGLIVEKEDERRFVLVEVNCETDFVVKNSDYRAFCNEVVEFALHHSVPDLDTLKDHFEAKRTALVAKIGENIQISRYLFLDKKSGCSYGSYSHNDGKIRSIVEISGSEDLNHVAKEVAMHCVAYSPEYLSFEEVPEVVKEQLRSILKDQTLGSKVKESMVDQVVQNKLKAQCAEMSLLDQKFFKNEKMTVFEYVRSSGNGATTVSRFIRCQVGG